MHTKTPSRRRRPAAKSASLPGKTTELEIDDAGHVRDVTTTAWTTAGRTLAGIGTVAIALTAWAFTFIIGGRPVINDLLHREIGGSTGVEIALAGLFAFGGIFILGLGWRLGTRVK